MDKNTVKLSISALIFSYCLAQVPPAYAAKKKNTPKTEKTVTTEKDSTDSKKDDYADLIKKGVYTKGMFNTIQVKTDIYFEIPDSLLNRQFLIVNKLSQVPLEVNDAGANTGMNYENKLITFHKDTIAKKVWVKTITPRVSSPADDAITKSVKTNFIESVLEVFDIEAQSPDSTATVIKVNKVFDGNQKSFNDVLNGLGLPTSIKTNLSYIEGVKTFPENIVVKSLLTTSVNEGSGDLPVSLGVTSNIVLLSEKPMQPRIADKRVGYFTEKHWFFSDAQHKMKEQEFITKWRMEPKEEDVEKYLRGELVEPKKPIVYYIDPATPPQWRAKIIAGVHDWQVAFEKAGFKNAIIAKEPTEEDKDFDIDDVRYSVITYAASPKSNAMGPSVIDPRSGEIIESDIIWWHNVMTSVHSWMRIQTGPIDPKARANKFTDEHMGEAIRFVSSHEVGHTFGLKHNMGSSYAFPVDSLRSKEFTDKMGGTAPSIMDYARYNYVAQPEDGVTAITPQIGLYDKYAIEWGYRWYPNQEEEKTALRKMIEDHQDDPMYFYGEQQSSLNIVDPRSQSEDLGDDAMKASEYGLKNLKIVVDNIIPWTYEEGEDYYEAGKLYMGAIGQWQMYNQHVLNNIGGVYLNHAVYGNNKKAYEPVPYEKQKRAVEYLAKNALQIPTWLFFNEVVENTYSLKDSPVGPFEYSPYSLARELQYSTLYYTLMDERLLRLLENEVQQVELGKEKNFTINDLFSMLNSEIFAPTKKGKSLSILERMTQKNYVDALIIDVNKLFEKTSKKGLLTAHSLQFPTLCNHIEEDNKLRNINYTVMKRVSEVTSYKKGELMNIKNTLTKKKNSGDKATRTHYADLINRINEALNL
ncbi:zinc-dependent metalloprotease [Myroides odoratimimus]|uniref:zinc-dependent metalloprotease n=1 Tax=Myroides odoratimimus TaxID=76832 RepID=UPI0025749014|nr:zinc-dependent metalloprotease [Myroides odoratimimus]MDM1397390.1 zinc-dependent metalloprotease [Myroides odoratimimus]